MKETTHRQRTLKRKLWIGYAAIIVILFACNLFLFPAMMQAKSKKRELQHLPADAGEQAAFTVQIEDQQIYFVDNENNSLSRPTPSPRITTWSPGWRMQGSSLAIVYQSPTIWDSLLNLALSAASDDPVVLVAEPLHRQKMQSMGGANSMLFGGGKSGAKQYVVDDKTGIKFNDVAGEDEAKESLQEIVDFKQPPKYEDIGAKMPKGVLLVGPPGTGKNAAGPRCGWRGRRALLSPSPAVSLWRCSWAWVPQGA